MTIYTPYTYLIGWSEHNTWYYGVRFSTKAGCLYESGCHPDELWTTYFTSSRYVKNFIDTYGNPDIIEIRKTFPEDAGKARNWEHKVLRRINAANRDDFLNKSDAISIPSQKGVPKPPGHAEKVGNYHRGKKLSLDTIAKMSKPKGPMSEEGKEARRGPQKKPNPNRHMPKGPSAKKGKTYGPQKNPRKKGEIIQKTLDKYVIMSYDEFIAWMSSFNMYRKDGRPNPNITRAIIARGESIEQYYEKTVKGLNNELTE